MLADKILGQLDVPVALFKVGLHFVLPPAPAAVDADLEQAPLYVDEQLGLLSLGSAVRLAVEVTMLEGRSDQPPPLHAGDEHRVVELGMRELVVLLQEGVKQFLDIG